MIGAIMGCGQQGQSESKVEKGEIDRYEIMEGYETLEVTGRLMIFPDPTYPRFLSLALFNCLLSRGKPRGSDAPHAVTQTQKPGWSSSKKRCMGVCQRKLDLLFFTSWHLNTLKRTWILRYCFRAEDAE